MNLQAHYLKVVVSNLSVFVDHLLYQDVFADLKYAQIAQLELAISGNIVHGFGGLHFLGIYT